MVQNNYKNGMRDGSQKYWPSDGSIHYEEHYTDGYKDNFIQKSNALNVLEVIGFFIPAIIVSVAVFYFK